MNLIKLMTTAAAVGVLTAGAASAQTLDAVKQRGAVQCGVTTGLAGFAAPNDVGEWEGFDVDFCRAMAAAVFGDPDMVNYTPTTAKERFTALQSGEIDLLARNTTWTFSRDVNLGFEFVGINYYDGQGFMVRTDLGVDSALELDGASVCIQTGTTTELNLADYFRTNGMSFEPVTVDTADQAREAYEAARCDVYTTDASGLAAQRSSMSDPSAHKILPEIISKEPLGPLVRHGDNQWGDIARWVLNAMVTAELVRGLREQHRRRHPARSRARSERPLERRGRPLLAAVPVMASARSLLRLRAESFLGAALLRSVA